MRTKVIKLLLKKELLDVFRDRKAIVMLVLVPLLIYPLIFFGSFAVMTMIQSNMEKGEYDVIVEADDDGNLVRQIDIYNKEKKKENEKKSDDSAITQNDSGSTDSLSIVSYQEAINRYNNSDNKSEDTYVTGSNHLDNIDALLQAEIIDVYVSAIRGGDFIVGGILGGIAVLTNVVVLINVLVRAKKNAEKFSALTIIPKDAQ